MRWILILASNLFEFQNQWHLYSDDDIQFLKLEPDFELLHSKKSIQKSSPGGAGLLVWNKTMV